MYVFVRLGAALIRSRFVPKIGPLDEVRAKLRIWPNDLDFNRHVNNGRYLTLFDIGRMDLTMRSGLWKIMWERRWFPVLSMAAIRFRKSVNAFTTMEMTTRIVFFDEKWMYIEHRLEKDGEVYARALVKGLFKGPEGKIPMPKILETMGLQLESPAMPETVRRLLDYEASLITG